MLCLSCGVVAEAPVVEEDEPPAPAEADVPAAPPVGVPFDADEPGVPFEP